MCSRQGDPVRRCVKAWVNLVASSRQGGLHELTAPAAPRRNRKTFLEYLAALGTVEQPLAVIHAAPAAPPWIGVQRNRTGVTN